MKKYIFPVLIIFIISTIIAISGCKESESNTEEYIITIDSIMHVDTLAFGEDLTLKFYGVIGIDGCYAFNNFEVYYSSLTLSVTTWGLYTKSEMCTQEVPYLNGETLLISDLPEGEISIEAIQADGSSLTRKVYVKK